MFGAQLQTNGCSWSANGEIECKRSREKFIDGKTCVEPFSDGQVFSEVESEHQNEVLTKSKRVFPHLK